MKDLRLSQIAHASTVHNNVHESVFRSYQVLALVRELLEKGTPGDVVLGLLGEIDRMQPRETVQSS